jgi:hypothetical protein
MRRGSFRRSDTPSGGPAVGRISRSSASGGIKLAGSLLWERNGPFRRGCGAQAGRAQRRIVQMCPLHLSYYENSLIGRCVTRIFRRKYSSVTSDGLWGRKRQRRRRRPRACITCRTDSIDGETLHRSGRRCLRRRLFPGQRHDIAHPIFGGCRMLRGNLELDGSSCCLALHPHPERLRKAGNLAGRRRDDKMIVSTLDHEPGPPLSPMVRVFRVQSERTVRYLWKVDPIRDLHIISRAGSYAS